MKFFLTLILLLSIIHLSAQAYIDKNGEPQLWGAVTVSQLKEEPYKEWFDKNYNDCTSNLTLEDPFDLSDVTVKIFIGSWCGDTQYLLPRFIHTWNHLGLDESQLKIVALHLEGDLYKQGPAKETQGYNIHRVPTFIFERHGQEINRIVERTQFDLDTDIRAIAQSLPYEPRYKAVTFLHDFMADIPQDSLLLKANINAVYSNISREVSSAGELNTYGYVLLTSGEIKKAEFVFLTNKHLFPFNPMVLDSYGKILLKRNKLLDAKEAYYEALRIKVQDKHIIQQLATIDDLLLKKINQ